MNGNPDDGHYREQQNELWSYVKQVAGLVRRQLAEFDKEAVFIMNYGSGLYCFSGETFAKKFAFCIEEKKVKKLRNESPFALDRWIWEQLEKKGIVLGKTTHYLKTVRLLSKIKSPDIDQNTGYNCY